MKTQKKSPKQTTRIIFLALIIIAVSIFVIAKTGTKSTVPTTQTPTQTAVNQTANWKTYTNSDAKYTVNYPNDWFNQGAYISNYPQGKFVSFEKRDEEMKQFPSPVLILLGQTFAGEEYKKYDFQKQQAEWGKWVLDTQFPYLSQGSIVKPTGLDLTNIFQYKAYAQKTCPKDNYNSLNYPCSIEIFIPNGLVAADIVIYGDVENVSDITKILSTFKFTK